MIRNKNVNNDKKRKNQGFTPIIFYEYVTSTSSVAEATLILRKGLDRIPGGGDVGLADN